MWRPFCLGQRKNLSQDTASETRETSCHPNIQVSGCCTQKFYDRTPAASVLPYHELFELTFLVLLYCWRYPGLRYPGSCECHDSWISQEELQLNSRSKKLYAILTSTKSARGHIIQNIFVFNKTNKKLICTFGSLCRCLMLISFGRERPLRDIQNRAIATFRLHLKKYIFNIYIWPMLWLWPTDVGTGSSR